MCSLLQTNPEDDQNPHTRAIGKLLTLTYRRSDASAMPPNPAILAKRLKERFPAVTSIMPHKHRTSLLIDVHDDDSCLALLKTTEVDDIPVTIRETNYELTTSKGTIDLSIFPNMSESDLLKETKNQGVLEVRQIVHTSNSKNNPTNLFVVTFNTQDPPLKLKVDHLSLHVDSRIPNPLRCFGCQWYGHTADQCLRDPICARCSQPGHDSKNCQEPPLCFHCRSDHPAYDRSCPMYKIEKLILEKRFRDKVPFKEARNEVYRTHPDLTRKIPRLTQKPHPTTSTEKPVTQSGMTYSQATSPNPDATKEPAITKATQDMIEALILTVEKQQEQIALLIGELTNMKSQFESMTLKTTSVETKITSDTETLDAVAQTEDIHYVEPTKSTQTENASHDTETQTTPFDPIIPFSPSSLSFLKETKVDNTLELETSHLNESEEMESRDGTSLKRKCISPIEAPKPEPTSPTDRNLQLSFATVHESDQSTSPTIGMNASHSHSDFAVDYHDVADHAKELNTQEESDPEESSTQSNDQDTDSTEGHQEQGLLQETRKLLRDALTGECQTLCVVQAYFFNKKLAQKMNATEIKTAVNHYLGGPYVCSVLQLKSPHGGHFIYIHSTNEERITPPFRFNLLSDTVETLEVPRKKIDKICECPEIFWYTSAGN